MARTRKTALSALDIAALLSELRPQLVGALVSKVYQVDEVVVLRLHLGERGRRDLVLSPRHGLWLTKYRIDFPKSPPPFCAQLRRKLQRLRLRDVRQHDLDRVVFLDFGKYVLVLEVVREGNLLLLDQSRRIVLAMRYARMRDRDVVPGAEYAPPPPRGANPLELQPLEFARAIRERPEGEPLVAAALRVLAVPREALERALADAGLSPEARVGEVSDGQLESLLSHVVELVRGCVSSRGRGFVARRGSELVGVYPFPPTAEGCEVDEAESFNECVDEYFTPMVLAEVEARRREELEREVGRLERVLEQQRRLREEYAERARALRRAAEHLSARMGTLGSLLDSARARGPLERVEGVEVVSVDPATGLLRVRVAGVELTLDPRLSAGENVSAIYNKAKELEAKCRRIDEEMERTLRAIERVRAAGERARPLILGVRRERRWYERFRWFVSSGGFLVIAGRDARQNERIVRSYLGDDDIFLHADIHGAPAVVVKAGGKEVDEGTIMEAAQFAASFSSAWRHGLHSVDVYWVRGSQVSKSPPSGLYLPRGAFMVYGRRNYIRGVRLAVAVGASVAEGGVELVCGPPSAVEGRCEAYALLIPGRSPKGEVARRLAASLSKLLAELHPDAEVRVRAEDLLDLIPDGESEVLEVRRSLKQREGKR